MQLTKEVKDILEGIHYFLIESLKDEPLRGEVECQRRGLLLQLQALKEPYPILHFKSTFNPNSNIRNGPTTTATTVTYFNTLGINGSSRMSTSSNGSTNYSNSFSTESSSNGYSGDGVISPRDLNDPSEPIQSASDDFSSETYEEFTEQIQDPGKRDPVPIPIEKSVKGIQRKDSFTSTGFDDKEDDECIVELVSFRVLLAKCDYYGTLTKRSKGIIRNSKSFLGVLIDNFLYLYQKETDDRQKKVIDISGYAVRDCRDESASYMNIKRQDLTFELVQPGKKTHTFQCTRRKEKDQWLDQLKKVELANHYNKKFEIHQSCLAKVDEISGNDSKMDVYDPEIYEVLGSEYDRTEFPCQPLVPQILSPSHVSVPTSSESTKDVDQCNYYTVPECWNEAFSYDGPLVNKPQRLPPERPPPPIMCPPISRPLPLAPKSSSFDEDFETASDDDIYCEIKEEFTGFDNRSFLESSRNSLSQEIFDTIDRRMTPLSEEKLSDDDDVNESYDIPNERIVPFSWSTVNRPLPSLPPKGLISSFLSDDDDSEYKVPTFSHSEEFYQVPSSKPIPIKSKVEIGLKEIPQKILKEDEEKVEVDSLKANSNNISEEVNNSSTPVVTVSKPSIPEKPKSEVICNELLETSLESGSNIPKTLNEKNSSNSVRDLIAKIDQRDTDPNKSYSIYSLSKQLNQNIKVNDNSNTYNFSTNLMKLNNHFTLNNMSRETSSLVKETSSSLKETSSSLKETSSSIKETSSSIKETSSSIKETSSSIKGTSLSIKGTSPLIREFDPLIQELCPIVNKFFAKKSSLDSTDSELNRQSLYSVFNVCFIAKFDYISSKLDHLNFSRGEELLVKEVTKDSSLWTASIRGKEGLVPKDYLRRSD